MSTTIPAIILVEDEPEILVVLRRVLRDLQLEHDIISVNNARSAIAQAAHHNCVLLITDYMLGGMNGIDLGREFKTRWHSRVILITAYDTDEVRAEADLNGIDDFLPKPFKVEALEATVRRVLALPNLPG